ncbi:MAG TPA: radical SAM protein [Bacteroidales bacterium]|nr:radical SAM protein [Bacteroidales bacterium]
MSKLSAYQRYTDLYKQGVLQQRAADMTKKLSDCTLCPRNCRVNRLKNEKGICKTGRKAMVSSYSAHFGEERPLVGRNGSGTIFFTNCNLLCNFCQNYDISHLGRGIEVDDQQLAGMMLDLQERGCHNINLVTPSHVVPQILSALVIAAEKGLDIPLVFNTGGYDKVSTLKELDKIIDIYMPDFKFWTEDLSVKTCNINNYRTVALRAINEMHRQVGDLIIGDTGLAVHGLLVRHLVLPGYPDETRKILYHISEYLSKNTYVNIMAQYYPSGEVHHSDRLGRMLRPGEHRAAVNYAKSVGLQRIDY